MQSPVLSCPADIVITNAHDALFSVVTFLPHMSDNCPNAGQPACLPASGSIFGVGTNTVFCSSTDAAGNLSQCSFQIVVHPGNVPPVPLFDMTPSGRFPGYTNLLVIAPNNTNASVLLDATKSYDTDDASFSYFWYEDGNLLSTNAATILILGLGTHEVRLVLDDHFPLGTNSTSVLVEVISRADAVELLLGLLGGADQHLRPTEPLTATLQAALAAFEQEHPIPALNLLKAFQELVRAQVMPEEPGLADELIRAAQVIIEAVTEEQNNRPHRQL